MFRLQEKIDPGQTGQIERHERVDGHSLHLAERGRHRVCAGTISSAVSSTYLAL